MGGDEAVAVKMVGVEMSNGGGGGDAVVAETTTKEVTLKELARRMASFAAAREWDTFHSPRNLLLALVGEVGELSEIFQWKGEVPRGLSDWTDAEKEHLGEELSDVLLYLVRLADVCNVNLDESALRKLEKNGTKYPIELCKGSSKKYSELAHSTLRRNATTTETTALTQQIPKL